jgi:hypothetical protein
VFSFCGSLGSEGDHSGFIVIKDVNGKVVDSFQYKRKTTTKETAKKREPAEKRKRPGKKTPGKKTSK